jgi:hypothetical protein
MSRLQLTRDPSLFTTYNNKFKKKIEKCTGNNNILNRPGFELLKFHQMGEKEVENLLF